MPSSPPPTVPQLETGPQVIRAALRTLPSAPGVYRMHDAKGNVLYVGKAKNLRKRVTSYAGGGALGVRIQTMVGLTASLEIITTHTEVEALLLESNLIKKLKPRYNILLRDDKSFPYIVITGGDRWPQLAKHRGARGKQGEYFGPFASARAVNETLQALQRAFPLRSCSDSVFASRTRPCLQYQIRRCTAPCVDRISGEDYDAIVDEARAFLSGRSHDIQSRLSGRMQTAAAGRDYETAAVFRDRIRALTQIQSRQGINIPGIDTADVVACHQDAGASCVEVFFFRSGQNFGNRAYFPAHAHGAEATEVIAAFLGQFYASRPPPKLVLLSHAVESRELIEAALSVRAGRRVRLIHPQRGAKRGLVVHAAANARDALARRLAESATQRRLLAALARALRLEAPPTRIEVYDNSHISGSHPVGAMIVAGPEGLMKNAYRRFTIKRQDLAPGDDYAMIQEVVGRRFTRLIKEDDSRSGGQWPDLVLIDGGAGQLRVALEVFADLGVTGVAAAAISKGRDRDAGREHIHVPGRQPFRLGEGDPVLYFLQRLRDEAHRFAIGAHRARRARAIVHSVLDEVPGIGAKRKRALLHHFGSARAVTNAGRKDLEAVNGISRAVAATIYAHFHEHD